MAYEYVKQYYGVPVEVGQRVTMKDTHRVVRTGTVVKKRVYDQYVHVRFDGNKCDSPMHPLDLEYGEKPDKRAMIRENRVAAKAWKV
jgi:hypothetical protein